MTNDELVEALRAPSRSLSPSELLRLADRLYGGPIGEFRTIWVLRLLFPQVPFSVTRDAADYFCNGGIDDETFDRMLSPP